MLEHLWNSVYLKAIGLSAIILPLVHKCTSN